MAFVRKDMGLRLEANPPSCGFMQNRPIFLCCFLFQHLNSWAWADLPPIEKLAEKARESIVVISSEDREGEESGVGTGFVVGENGIIATNFHVIGQHRGFSVRFSDGRKFSPVAILARDEKRDLALVKIDAEGLPALTLGDSATLKPGQSLFALGNPLGLEFSVSRGVLAATRDVEGVDMIQLAMPIEPGSSGSPVMDMEGRVCGVIAIKSGAAMGFAVPVNRLKPHLEKPNPIPFNRWLTIGAIDPDEWSVHLGAEWRQRAGKIVASGRGTGFGGRTLCISTREPPEDKFSCEVEVKLAEESGAAGLAFYYDGKDTHYGFYPTNGAMRLTRFAGPDVFNWTILETVTTDAYNRGDWNRIRVDYNKGKMVCSVNGKEIIEFKDNRLKPGSFGLVKFRNPGAEFRNLRFGDDIPDTRLPRSLVAKVDRMLDGRELKEFPPRDSQFYKDLLDAGKQTPQVLRNHAKRLVQEAKRMDLLAESLQSQLTIQEMRKTLSPGEGKPVRLLEAALLLSRLDNPYLPSEPYLRRVDRIVQKIVKGLPDCADDRKKLDALIHFLFNEQGFHGSDLDYYHRSNSYINEVIDDREGIPITLCVLFVEIARKMGLPVYGVAIPRHFIAAYHPPGECVPLLIDVFNSGKYLTLEEAGELSGSQLTKEDIKPAAPNEILVRMLHNLYTVAEMQEDTPSMIRYLDCILALDQEDAYNRAMRAVLLASQDRVDEAIRDLEWIVNNEPPGIQMTQVQSMLRRLYLRTQDR